MLDKQDTIVVNLNDLYKTIRQMRRNDMSYAQLTILPGGADEFGTFPASLHFAGISSSIPDFAVEYEPLDASDVPVPKGMMSSNNL